MNERPDIMRETVDVVPITYEGNVYVTNQRIGVNRATL
jgi:hypothetical protein